MEQVKWEQFLSTFFNGTLTSALNLGKWITKALLAPCRCFQRQNEARAGTAEGAAARQSCSVTTGRSEDWLTRV